MALLKIYLLVGTMLFLWMNEEQHPGRSIMNHPSITLPVSYVEETVVHFKDTIPGKILFTCRSEEGIPISYFRKITTSVCIDGECRILNIVLHWAITGRYLGFELPEGEFLSKTEHVEFNDDEYKRLHELLSDRYSLLANFTLSELVPKKNANENVDAISSATIADVLDYIVEGAVYTTYTLWHIVYGNTWSEIISNTEKELSPKLIRLILNSHDLNDQVWALNHIRGFIKLTPELQDRILGFIHNENFLLAERAINAISSGDLASDTLQLKLYDKFADADFGVKRLLLEKLEEAPSLNSEVAHNLALGLGSFQGSLIRNILELFEKHNIEDIELCSQIAILLSHKNKYISGKAYRYLDNIVIHDNKVNRKLSRYRSKYQL